MHTNGFFGQAAAEMGSGEWVAKRVYMKGHHAAFLFSSVSPHLASYHQSYPLLSVDFLASLKRASVGLYVLCHPRLKVRMSIIRPHD